MNPTRLTPAVARTEPGRSCLPEHAQHRRHDHGDHPRTSALNKYLQSWDCHNLFSVGANVFRTIPCTTRPGRWGARLLDADAIKNRYLKNPGPAGGGMTGAAADRCGCGDDIAPRRRHCARAGRCETRSKAVRGVHACHSLERGAQGWARACTEFSGAAGEWTTSVFPALKRSGITWTETTLDAYIADPQKAVPANRMPYAGMPEARDRADLIIYMQEAFK